jgi:hypothetical protein
MMPIFRIFLFSGTKPANEARIYEARIYDAWAKLAFVNF